MWTRGLCERFLAHLIAHDVDRWVCDLAQWVLPDRGIQKGRDDLNGGYTRIVHEYQLWMATFVEAVASSYAPCGGVLGVGYEAIFDFGDFDFPYTALDGH